MTDHPHDAPEAGETEVERIDLVPGWYLRLSGALYDLVGPMYDGLPVSRLTPWTARAFATAIASAITSASDAACESRDLVRAGALILAEIERIDRCSQPAVATEAADSARISDDLRRLSEAATPGPWSVSGVRRIVDEESCTFVDAGSLPGLMAFPTADRKKALEALADAKFMVGAVNWLRSLLLAAPAPNQDGNSILPPFNNPLNAVYEPYPGAFDSILGPDVDDEKDTSS